MLPKTLFSLLLVLIFFAGCAKNVDEYNKPAIYWYSKLIESVGSGNLEKADDYYSSLQGEHVASPLLKEATMIMAIAHYDDEEYLLSEHFLDEYINRYANTNEKEFSEFLKVKAKYKSLPRPRRDQALIDETIEMAKKFEMRYPHSEYYALVDSMLTRLYLSRAALNEMIALLYKRIDKPRSAVYYKQLQPSWIKWDEIEEANIPWYREWFVGDGTGSWYGFMIPHTRSVVSRNSVQDENITKEKENAVK